MLNVPVDQSPTKVKSSLGLLPVKVAIPYRPTLAVPESLSITTRVPLGVVTSGIHVDCPVNVVRFVDALYDPPVTVV